MSGPSLKFHKLIKFVSFPIGAQFMYSLTCVSDKDIFQIEKLSIIDVLFNKGPETINSVKKNYKLLSF